MTLKDHLLTVARAYCLAQNRSLSRIATQIFNDGKKFNLLEAGAGISTDQFEKAMHWFSDRWPPGTDWPEDILRPDPRPIPSRPTVVAAE